MLWKKAIINFTTKSLQICVVLKFYWFHINNMINKFLITFFFYLKIDQSIYKNSIIIIIIILSYLFFNLIIQLRREDLNPKYFY